MYLKDIRTADTNRASCYKCKEPIIKSEGCSSWSNGSKYCFRCTMEYMKGRILDWKLKTKILRKANHRSEKVLRDRKIARML